MTWGTRRAALLAVIWLAAAASPVGAENGQLMPQFVPPGMLIAPTTVASQVARDASNSKDAPAATAVKAEGSWPKTLDEAKAEARAKSDPRPDVWPAATVAAAKAHCAALLKTIDAVAIPATPMKRGACGAPAPLHLVSIGRNPEVVLSPPALVTCDMAVALYKWIKSDLQPLARKHLSAPLVKIEVMSDYSCRNAYGRAKTRLSEHGRANALDIRSFVTAKADTVAVLDDWGPTERDVRAQIAAANAAAAKAAAARAAHADTAAASSGATGATTRASEPEVRGTLAEGLASITTVLQGDAAPARRTAGFSLGEPSRLGGPKVSALAPLTEGNGPVSAPTGRARFLREAHASGCRTFGTVLGPEANNAHRNHLHVDAAQRSSGSFCQ